MCKFKYTCITITTSSKHATPTNNVFATLIYISTQTLAYKNASSKIFALPAERHILATNAKAANGWTHTERLVESIPLHSCPNTLISLDISINSGHINFKKDWPDPGTNYVINMEITL